MNTEYLAHVAYLVSHGFSQLDTTRLLGLNKSEAARLVRRARALGLLTRPTFCEEAFHRLWPDPEMRINLKNLQFGLKLLEGLKSNAQKLSRTLTLIEVEVFPTVSYETTPEAWSDRLLDFGCRASPHLHGVLLKSGVCAMGWGGTLGAIVSAARRDGFGEKPPHPALAATCGELFDHLGFNNASSSLVERLHLLLNGKKPNAHTFRGVPALLDNPTLRDFYLRKHPGYRAVMSSGGFAERFDAILTSVGTFEQEGVHAFKRALITEWNATEESLKKISWGDLGGVLVPRHKLTLDDQKEFDRIASLWTGITLEHYRETARRAAKLATSQTQAIPGVVIYAIGANKAEIVHEIVLAEPQKRQSANEMAGLVNRIVIDMDCAQALAQRANINLLEDIRAPYPVERGIETVQEIITAFDRLSDVDKAAVREHLQRRR
jgi:DNA-binding transcriptional regulator LsrR (DeoR family)